MNALGYWTRLARLFFNYTRKAISLPYLPVRLWIELTSDCNYQCVMCPNKDLKNEDRGFMDMALFRKIVDEISGFAFEINLAHRGESLLHPQVVEAIRYAKSKKIYTRLHTNGSLLTEETARGIVASGLDRLSFSFDGYDKKTYEKIRRGGDFDRTVNNIVRFLAIKKEAGDKKPETAIEVIDFKKNNATGDKKARDAFKAHFKGLPLDSFVIKELHNWAGEIKSRIKKGKYTGCPFPWNALVICWDGAVIPCTQDFFNDNIVGNAGEASITHIWNNSRMQDLRKKLGTGDIHSLHACSRCDRPWRERILGVPKEYLWKFMTKRMP